MWNYVTSSYAWPRSGAVLCLIQRCVQCLMRNWRWWYIHMQLSKLCEIKLVRPLVQTCCIIRSNSTNATLANDEKLHCSDKWELDQIFSGLLIPEFAWKLKRWDAKPPCQRGLCRAIPHSWQAQITNAFAETDNSKWSDSLIVFHRLAGRSE